MKSICVFCGSSDGNSPIYREVARTVGASIAAAGLRLVYGAGGKGMMGAVADGALGSGGKVTGVIPGGLFQRENVHRGLTDLKVVGSMHERKFEMSNLSDAFLILPGGIGTMDEFFEAWTWSHLGIQSKPVAVLNVLGFFDDLLSFADRLLAEGFLPERSKKLLLVESEIGPLIEKLQQYVAPKIERPQDKLFV